jgi:hypothetical protein
MGPVFFREGEATAIGTRTSDLAPEIREYMIPDFSNWKDHDSFEASFDRLLKSLMAEELLGASTTQPAPPETPQ